MRKTGVTNKEDKINERNMALTALESCKQLEREKKKKLVRVKLPKGYVYTTDPQKWEDYKPGILL